MKLITLLHKEKFFFFYARKNTIFTKKYIIMHFMNTVWKFIECKRSVFKRILYHFLTKLKCLTLLFDGQNQIISQCKKLCGW